MDDEQLTTREYLPWSIAFGIIGMACGIAESSWLQLRPQFWPMISGVLFAMGWGLGFDVANRRRMSPSKTQLWIFSDVCLLFLILVAAMCGGAGVLINGQLAPRAP